MNRRLDIGPLQTFCAVADCGSLNKAAQRVNRSQAAVSQQMQTLEAAIGRPLLTRSRQGAGLTAAGRELLDYARRMLALHEEALLRIGSDGPAGVLRLGLTEREDVDFQPMNPEQWTPAVSQGALAIECRADDEATLAALKAIHHEPTALCVRAERAFLRAVEGDCRVPVGAMATHDRGQLRLKGFIGSPDGKTALVETAMGTDPAQLGQQVADAVLNAGGREVLAALRA